MKSKTMCKRTRAVKKKKAVFQPVASGTSLGSGAAIDFNIEDANLSPVHALVGLHDDGQVYLKALGRTYFLIGKGWGWGVVDRLSFVHCAREWLCVAGR